MSIAPRQRRGRGGSTAGCLAFRAVPEPGRPTGVVDAARSPRRRSFELRRIAWHLVVLTAVCALALPRNLDWLYYSLDGQYLMTNVANQWLFRANWLGIGWNPLQGLGGPWYPFDARLFPGFLLSAGLSGGGLSPVVSLATMAIELFVATYFLGRSVGAGPTVAAVAGWLTVLCMIPLVGQQPVYPVMNLAPEIGTVVSAGLIAIGCLYRVGPGAALAWAAGVLLPAIWLVMAAPVLTMIVAPPLALLAFGALTATGRRRELAVKLAVVVALAGGVVFAGPLHFVSGLISDTPAAVFSADLPATASRLADGSILFQSERGAIGPLLFLAASGGGVWAARFGAGPLRVFGVFGLAAQALMVLASAAVAALPQGWVGPQITYFEFALWPVYALLAAIGLTRLGVGLWSLGRWRSCALSDSRQGRIGYALALLALAPGGLFQGRVANVTGTSPSSPAIWLSQSWHDHLLTRETGNDHRLVGLWYFNVPTLEEYSSTVSPAFYLATRTLLVEPSQRLLRGILTISRPNLRVLEAMGVRFVVAAEPPPEGVRVVATMPTDSAGVLRLWELPAPNLTGWSPVRVERPVNGAALIERLRDPTTDLRRVVLTHEMIAPGLVPARHAAIVIERDGIRIRALSEGRSVLVIPFDYSRCLVLGHGRGSARLFRANLFSTGIEFVGALDRPIRFAYGPFTETRCRLRDLADFRAAGYAD